MTKLLNSQKIIIHSWSQGQIQLRSHSLSRSSYYKFPFPDVLEEVYIQLLIEEAYSASSELEPDLRAAITEQMRAKLQQENCLPFSSGHSQEDNKNETTVYVCDEHCKALWHWNNNTYLLEWKKTPVFAEKQLLNSNSESKEQVRKGPNDSQRLEPLSLGQNKRCPSCGKGQVESDYPSFICLSVSEAFVPLMTGTQSGLGSPQLCFNRGHKA